MGPGGLIAMMAAAPLTGAPTAAPAAATAEKLPVMCVQAVRFIGAGTIPTRADFRSASCRADHPKVTFAYDGQSRAARAARNILEGDVVAAPPEILVPDISPGQSLFLSSTIGPVTVQHRVTALQAGRSGEALFVRTESGRVISVPYDEARR